MKKFSFITILALSGVISSSALAQNYYDPGYFQDNTGEYPNNNYAYYQGYSQPQYYGYQQNYGYYQQPAADAQRIQSQPQSQVKKHPASNKKHRGVAAVSVGVDYVLGYTSFLNKDYDLGAIFTGSPNYTYTTRDFEKQSNALSANLGWRPHKNIGIEAFYTSSLKTSTKENLLSDSGWPYFATAEKETSYTAYGIDIIGYYQINDYIEFLASIGVGKYDYTADVTVDIRDVGPNPNVVESRNHTFEDSVTAYRIGGGFQVWLSKYLAFRLTGRWTQLGGDFADYITEVNMGVRYHFQ